MAITISQTNIVEGANLLAVHNPLIFLISVTHSGTPPEWCHAGIGAGLTYNCLFLRDESATERTFYFVADEILRSHMGKLSNFDQASETLLAVGNLSKEITIGFTVEGIPDAELLIINIVNAAKDFENINGACMVDEYTNQPKTYVAQKNVLTYLYWYNDNDNNVIKILNPNGLLIYPTANTTVYNMGPRLQSIYPDIISYNNSNLNGKLWCQRDTTQGGISIGFQFQTGPYPGTLATYSNISCDFPYTLTELEPGKWRLKMDILTNPTPGQGFSFDCNLFTGGSYNITGIFGTDQEFTFSKGFIRYAINPTESHTFNRLSINDVIYPHNVIVRNECPGYILLRYADRNGQYRVMPFNKFYSRTINPEAIGEINNLVLSLRFDKGDVRPVGFRNKDTLKLTAIGMSETEYSLLKDLFTSPDVQANINGKWLRVKVQGDNVIKLEKRTVKDVTITIELPQSYNITEL